MLGNTGEHEKVNADRLAAYVLMYGEMNVLERLQSSFWFYNCRYGCHIKELSLFGKKFGERSAMSNINEVSMGLDLTGL